MFNSVLTTMMIQSQKYATILLHFSLSYFVDKNIFKVHFISLLFTFGGINYDKIIQSVNTAEKNIYILVHSISTTMMMKRRSINNRVSHTHQLKEPSRQTFIIKNRIFLIKTKFIGKIFCLGILKEKGKKNVFFWTEVTKR